MVREKILKAQADIFEGKEAEGQKSIIYDLIMDDELPVEDKSIGRLEAEFIGLVAAG